MPTYEYQCVNCGYRFEKFQRMKDEALKECPKCGSKVKRLIGSGIGVIFRGKGFYATDYKNETPANVSCCGRTQRCDNPPCSDDGVCKRE